LNHHQELLLKKGSSFLMLPIRRHVCPLTFSVPCIETNPPV
jgi:hypothetical protein